MQLIWHGTASIELRSSFGRILFDPFVPLRGSVIHVRLEDNFPPAVRVIERLNPKRVLLDHYDDTFPPVTRPVDLTPILNKYDGYVAAMGHGKIEEI